MPGLPTYIFRAAEMPFYQACTLLELVELTQSPADAAAARVEEARSIFARLKAKPWLERLDRIAVAQRI
jgi:hypothetical protein